ncbi:MAG: Wzz/FepE/Etk N-terminal domain-containing protein [Clostridiaceae bacterium]
MDNETELDLKELFCVIKKRIQMIIVVTLLTTFIAAIVSVFLISPTYESSVGIIISKQDGEKITGQDVTMYQNLMQTYKDIAGTNKVAELAASKLGNKIEAKDLLEMTTITTKTGTMVLTIAVDSKSATDAYKDVQAYAEAFVERAKELLPEGDIKIMDNAQLPESPVKPNKKLIIAAAFLLGFLVSAGTAFLLEYMNNTLVTKDDVEKYLNISVIGVIPDYESEKEI